MLKKHIGIILLAILIVGIAVPVGFTAQSDKIVATYGETTFNDQQYKSVVDDFFKNQAHIDVKNVDSKVITAGEVNKVASTISHKTYTQSQIYSCALVDLTEQGNIKVTADTSKITTVTAEMYISALKSAGITHGHIYVTSPVQASGESALAGIMNSYEQATNIQIPDTVKEAANKEIYTEAEIVEKDNVSADQLTNMVDNVKKTVEDKNVTDHKTIVNIIYNYTENNNIQISNSSIENLATSIQGTQSVKGDVQTYSTQLNQITGNNTTGLSLDGILNQITSIFN